MFAAPEEMAARLQNALLTAGDRREGSDHGDRRLPRGLPRRLPAAQLARWAALTILLIKLLALIPHVFVLVFLGIAQWVVAFIAQFVVAFKGEYPAGMHEFVTGVLRWGTRVGAFALSAHRQVPALQPEADGRLPGRHRRATADRAQPRVRGVHHRRPDPRLRRRGIWLVVWVVRNADTIASWGSSDGTGSYSYQWNFPSGGSGLLLRQLAAIPHYIVLAFLGIAAFFIWFVVQWIILFVARFPAGLYEVMEGYMRWTTRVSAYALGLVDCYPPFTLSASLTAQAPAGGALLAGRSAAGAVAGRSAGRTGAPPSAPPAEDRLRRGPRRRPRRPRSLRAHRLRRPRHSRSRLTCPSPGNAAYYVVPARPGPAWGISSAGRAPGSHPGGQRFDSAMLHHFLPPPGPPPPTGRLVRPVVDVYVGELHHRRVRVELDQQRPALRADRLRRVRTELVAAAQAGGRDRPVLEVQPGPAEELVFTGEHLEVHLDGVLGEVRRRRHHEVKARDAARAVGRPRSRGLCR